MAGKKPFINPLTQSSELDLHVDKTERRTDNHQVSEIAKPKQKAETFEDTHQRFTGWVRRDLKKQFDELADQRRTTKSALLDEAIVALIHKQERKPYTRKNQGN